MLLIIAYVILAHAGAGGFWFFLVTVCWLISLGYKLFIFGVLFSDMRKEAKERGKITEALSEVRRLIRSRFEAL